MATSRYGIGLTADSAVYISAAESLLEGRGYTAFTPESNVYISDTASLPDRHAYPAFEPLTDFPPLYPTALAAPGLVWSDLVSVARWLNAAIFGLTVGIATGWIRARLRSRAIALFASIAILFSPALIAVAVYAWSEALFMLVTFLCLVELEGFSRIGGGRRLLLAAVLAALAWATRYAGLAVVTTGVVWILVQPRRLPFLARLGQVLVFSTVIAGLTMPWVVRNFLLSSTPLGTERPPSRLSLLELLGQVAGVLATWELPESLPTGIRLAGVCLALLTVVALVVWFLKRPSSDSVVGALRGGAPLALYAVIYLALIVFSSLLTALEPIGNRYLAPLYIPLVMLFALLFDAVLGELGRPLVKSVIIGALGCWLLYPLTTSARLMGTYLADGAGGFHTSRWVDSATVQYVKTETFEGTSYANEPYGLYLLTGTIAKQSPRRYFFASSTPTDDLLQLDRTLQAHAVVRLVWFTGTGAEWLYSPNDLGTGRLLQEMTRLPDGAAYLLSAPVER